MGNRKCLYVDNSSTDRTGRGFLAVTDGDYYLYTGRHILIRGEKTKKEFKYVVFGCLLVIFGGILLGYMKAA